MKSCALGFINKRQEHAKYLGQRCHHVCARRQFVSVAKAELKDPYQAHRRRSNKVDPSLCLQFVPLTGFDAFPASACHVKPF